MARILVIFLTLSLLAIFKCDGQHADTSKHKIQVAVLLDVSGSMDHLILKAKSQFWKIATYLETGTKRGRKPMVQFAIIVYGRNDSEEPPEILTDFNSDLDSVSMNLHEIAIGGGVEYCWTAIDYALHKLSWSKKRDDLKLIIIAGNESFNQEEMNEKKVIQKAKKMSVVVNTIYCSRTIDTVNDEWKKAAVDAGGQFISISLADSVNLKENSLDYKLSEFNDKLNATYVPYGPAGKKEFARMVLRDKNAKMAGAPFLRERVNFKISESFRNPSWDLVDAFDADSTIVDHLGRTVILALGFEDAATLKEFLINKRDLRNRYKDILRNRYQMIKKYLGENKGDKDLELAVKEIIDKQGRKKNFQFRNEEKPANVF